MSMSKRLAVAGAAIALGALPGAAQAAGVLHVDLQGGLPSVDPALDYTSVGWQAEHALCLQLVSPPDSAPAPAGALVPDAAQGLPRVSADGRTYTFTIRPGLAFSDGSAVTAAAFARAIARVQAPTVGSPAARLFANVRTARSRGLTLTIVLRRADPATLSLLATPLACAVPADTPLAPVVTPLPSAGPYVLTSADPSGWVLARNPHYGGSRPALPDEIDYQTGVDPELATLAVESGAADYLADGLPPDQVGRLYDQYGPGAVPQRLFVTPQLEVSYLALNTSRPLFADPTVRQAVNDAIDRPALAAAAGPHTASVTDQVLPPGMPGYSPNHRYPLAGPNLAAARALMAGRTATAVLYTANRTADLARAALLQSELGQIGITVDVHAFPRAEQIQREGTRGEPFDMTTEGWVSDFADPEATFGPLLDGSTIGATGNTDVSYFDDPAIDARIEQASQLTGNARVRAYRTLDRDVTKAAPWAAWGNVNELDLVSARTSGVLVQPGFGVDLAALQLG